MSRELPLAQRIPLTAAVVIGAIGAYFFSGNAITLCGFSSRS